MEIKKYWCENCKKEHVVKTYENKSEALSDKFIESIFPIIWKDLKEKYKDLPLEEFCREVVFDSIYHFHKHMKKLKVENTSIKQKEENGIPKSEPD